MNISRLRRKRKSTAVRKVESTKSGNVNITVLNALLAAKKEKEHLKEKTTDLSKKKEKKKAKS